MKVAELEGEKHVATVQLEGGGSAVAEFRLAGRETYVQIYGDNALPTWPDPPEFLQANLPDGTRLTFMGGVVTTRGTMASEDNRTHYTKLQPQWVSVGRRPFTEDSRVVSLEVLVDDAASIFYDFDAFGYDMSAEQHIDVILASNSGRLERTIERGEHPIIGYFTGRWTICRAETALGQVSAHHRLLQSMGGPAGVRLGSRIVSELRPPTPTSLREAIDAFFSVLRFLELTAGRPQNVLEVIATLASDEEHPPQVEIYWPLRPQRHLDLQSPGPADMPLNGGIAPHAFATVLTNWLSRDATRREARVRYATAASRQNSYNVDRLVGAANMFDVLPADALPADNALPSELTEAREAAREIFRALSGSPERDSVLGALGRITHSSLKRKVRHRAFMVTAAAGERFPDLELVVDEAVNCRNRYVHGSDARIDYAGDGSALVPFLTDTLEFVFGASELIEAGWDIAEWLSAGTTMSHPWGTYRVSYCENLARLRALFPSPQS